VPKGGVVANVVVPAPSCLAFAAHDGFRPDFCEAADPESKGLVEQLVGYAKRDRGAVAWCAEVNGQAHNEIAAVPPARLLTERAVLRPLPSLRPAPAPAAVRTVDRLRTVDFASARCSVPGSYRMKEARARGGGPTVMP
jgi:hypothetical protein